MTVRIYIGGGPGFSEASLRSEFRKRARGLKTAAAQVADFSKAFIAVDEALDAQIKRQFSTQKGWAKHKDVTTKLRKAKTKWYSQSGSGGVGTWTGKLKANLLNEGPQGSKIIGPHTYSRHYRLAGEIFRGRDVAKRALEFHTGVAGKMPARPFFGPLERELIADRIVKGYITRRITGPANGKRLR
ncbi:MAG: hypothetical protein ACI88C_000052 [Acidimicrobiales bacterium]|jgi:hypothetical protein